MFACIISDKDDALELARAFSPRVQRLSYVDKTSAFLIDLVGLDRLLGSPLEIARKIFAQGASRVAVAANPDAAICAARAYAGVTVVQPGRESRLLGPLPLDFLDPPPEIAETLRLWGLRTFNDLAALPETALATRLGAVGVALQRRARGAMERPLLPMVETAGFAESMELDYPLAELEPLAFVLSGLLNTLCTKLESRGMAAEELHLDLKLEKAHHERTLRLPFPMRDRKGLLKLLLLDLETHPPPAEVVAVTLSATPAPPRTLQQGLFLPAAPEPEKLEITLARIARLVGAEHVGSPEILDTHRPDAFRMVKFRLPAPSNCGRAAPVPRDRVPRIALRLFRPPLAAIVRLAGTRPVSVKARNIDGAVEALAGPWRSSGDWWTPHQWSRDEWDIALPNGVYRVYQDLDTSRWFVDGCYD